ncbi:hypothetical protein GCM10010335_44250 [Streptomyces galbus]|nr:FAD-binding protein [Streptomyces galbus]GHD41940.1 hypothetical protein GCM10010335_44250 [Streptomyces galbus]
MHRRPLAVLRPGSVRDVAAMVRFCARHRTPVAARGQGHAPSGQAQVRGGLVVETAPLAAIGALGPDSATVTVGAGAKWSDVARGTLAHSLTPPVFTDYLELSVGGTLSVGGIPALPDPARPSHEAAVPHARRPGAVPLRSSAPSPPDDTAAVRRTLAANRAAYEAAAAAAGTQYPVGRVPFDGRTGTPSSGPRGRNWPPPSGRTTRTAC